MVTTELGACEWFVWDLRRSNLIDRTQLDDAVHQFLEAHQGAEPPALADHLVNHGLLTHFQCERLLQGKTQGFVVGPFTLLDVLGTGSMGTVYKARSKTDSKNYAVKVLPRRSMWNVRIARRKVQLFQLCKHPAVLPFVDVGTSGGIHYLAWPFIEGQTLEHHVTSNGPLEPADAARVGREVAQGLASCHPNDLVHGLLKPSNLMITTNGEVRILDFGIGCLLAEAEAESIVDTMSTANSVTNGLDCTSPESIMDPSNISPAGDQYSLGCIMYYCLTGRYPFPDGTAVEKMMAHQTKRPTPLAQLNPEIPAGLIVIVDRLMAKKAEDRFPDAGAAAEELTKFAAQARTGSLHHISGPARDHSRQLVESARQPVVMPREPAKKPPQVTRETVQNTSCPTPTGTARVPSVPKHDNKLALPTRQSLNISAAHPKAAPPSAKIRATRPTSPSGEKRGFGGLGMALMAILVALVVWLVSRMLLH